MNKKTLIAAAGVLSAALAQNAAATVSWIDWTSTTTGTMDVNGTSVGVTLSGDPAHSYVDGTYFYDNANTGGTSAGGTYGGLEPEDMIRLYQGGTFTLTFDQTVSDLYMALVSVGQPSYGVTYDFNDDFSVISSGSNYWGYNGYSISGNDLTGTEFNGILEFTGAFDSITFSTNPNEYWHGFNFGVEQLANGVPAPAPLALMLAGLAGISLIRKQKHA